LDQLATLFYCRKDCSSLVLDELVLQFGSESHFDFLEYHFGVHDERVCVCHGSIHRRRTIWTIQVGRCYDGTLGKLLKTGVDDYLHPDEDAANDRLIGDLVAMLAALGFATYAVQIRTLFPQHARYSMKVILGYIGAINTIALSPLAIYHVLHKPNGMDSRIVALAMLRGLFDYVLCEYLFFRAVLLTTATVASVGLGLTIPMAFLADYILGMENLATVYSIGGALCILIITVRFC
jgi:drug/metabolite transporter (DMT)-like permease